MVLNKKVRTQPNYPKQTAEWEDACLKGRRNIYLRKRRLEYFDIKKNDFVLDLGCGDGLNIKILRRMGVKKIYGVDISKRLLSEAKKNNPRTRFYRASSESLPFKSNTFDVVLVDSVFHHLMRYGKSLKEIKRVLKSKGRLCFSEPHRSFLRSLYDKISEHSLAKYVPVLKIRSAGYLGEIELMKHWLRTEEDFYETLSKLGFKERLKKKDILSIIGVYETTKKPR